MTILGGEDPLPVSGKTFRDYFYGLCPTTAQTFDEVVPALQNLTCYGALSFFRTQNPSTLRGGEVAPDQQQLILMRFQDETKCGTVAHGKTTPD